MELYRRRLVHYHYIKSTEEYNELHYAALADLVGMFRRHLFCPRERNVGRRNSHAEGCANTSNKELEHAHRGRSPCPVVFDPDDVRETLNLEAEQREADESLEACRDVIGFGAEGWVPAEHYEEAMARCKELKKDGLAATEPEEERAQVAAHWPLDDMDEEEYM
jgi:hypothetical protein